MTIKALNPNKQIVISNTINEARFRMNKFEQKLLLYFIGVVDNRSDFLNIKFEMSVTDFADFLELKRKDLHKTMYDTTREIASRVVEFRNELGNLVQMPVLSKVEYKKGTVEIKVNSELAPYLVGLRNQFTKFSLSEVLSFKSLYSMRIYQILSQWVYKGNVDYSIEELRFMLDIKPNEYTLYSNFKIKVLEVALKEINKTSTLKYTYKEVKTGRKVTSITFTIKKIDKAKLEQIEEVFAPKTVQPKKKEEDKPKIIPEKVPDVNFVVIGEMKPLDDSQIFKRLVSLGYSRQNSQKIIEECGEDYVIFVLEKSKIETRSKIDNKAGYFTSVIGAYKEIYKDEKQREEEEKEQARISQELQEQREKEQKEKEERFNQEQEELSRDILEQEPELFCKTIYKYFDTFIDINWGFHYEPSWKQNRENGKKEENIRIAKEIRSQFRACSSLRDFRNLIKYDYEWLFTSVFNDIKNYDENSDDYYKSKRNMGQLDKIELPFKI
jgi:plasmid replication initiation protein